MTDATPLQVFDGIILKREDQNQSGSVKDRGMVAQIEQAVRDGHTHVVISSSGNASISAAYLCSHRQLHLTAFVSPNINQGKLKRLNDFDIDLRATNQPLTDSLQYAQETGAFHLRQATSNVAVQGYASIARELWKQVPELSKAGAGEIGIFIPTSSGTTLIGLYQGFNDLSRQKHIFTLPSFHAVQTTAIHPIAVEFDTDFKRKARSIADAIVPPLDPPRKATVVDTIQETKGGGWVISDQEILHVDDWLQDRGIDTSYEGALALAGYRKYIRQTNNPYRLPIIILTGSRYTDST